MWVPPPYTRYITFFLAMIATVLFAFTTPSQTAAHTSGASQGEPDADEIAVMAVILDAAYAHATPGWVWIIGRTATFECNSSANVIISIGGCSGMRLSAETPDERLAWVRERMPQVSPEVTSDLLKKSQQSMPLSRPLPAPVRQTVWIPGMKQDFGSDGNPTFAAYFSRVGFDPTRTSGLVYLGTMSWTDQSKSVGQYLYLEKGEGCLGH